MGHENHQTHMVCPWWFTWTFDNRLRKLLHKPEDLLGPYLQPGMTALDLGCGFGYFSLGMARMLRPEGRVLAVDLQQQMLAQVRKRAVHAGLLATIEPRLCEEHSLRLQDVQADFALAFWMAHEVPDQHRLFAELHAALKPGARFFLAEPTLDTTASYFQKEIQRIEAAGFRYRHCPEPAPAFSLAAIFTRL